MPVWGHRRWRLYSTDTGHWMFGCSTRMDEQSGVVSSVAHTMSQPQDILDWDVVTGGSHGTRLGSDGQWRRCTLISITDGGSDAGGTSVVTARRPSSGTVRTKPQRHDSALHCRTEGGGTEYTEGGEVRAWSQGAALVRLELLCVTEGVSPPAAEVLERMAGLVAEGGATLMEVLAGLSRQLGLHRSPAWTRTPEGIERRYERHALQLFFATYDPGNLASAAALHNDIELGRYSYAYVLKKLCERYGADAAALTDWTGEYPLALREGFASARADASSATALEFIHIKKAPTDALQISWRDHVYLSAVAPGGLGDRHGLGRYVGCRCHSVNGAEVKRWQELLAATTDSADLTFAFEVKSYRNAPCVLRKVDTSPPDEGQSGQSLSGFANLQRQFTAGDLRGVADVQRRLSMANRTMSIAQLSALVTTPSYYGMSRQDSLRMAKHIYPQGGAVLDVLEDEHEARLAVAKDLRNSLVASILPRFAAVTLGAAAHHNQAWNAAAKVLREQRAEPTPSMLSDYHAGADALARTLETAKMLRSLFKELPQCMARLVERADTALTTARQRDAAADKAKRAYDEHRAGLHSLEEHIQTARTAGRPFDMLQQELGAAVKDGRDLSRSMLDAYRHSALHCWRCCAPDSQPLCNPTASADPSVLESPGSSTVSDYAFEKCVHFSPVGEATNPFCGMADGLEPIAIAPSGAPSEEARTQPIADAPANQQRRRRRRLSTIVQQAEEADDGPGTPTSDICSSRAGLGSPAVSVNDPFDE
eukprot:TRINITY_DN17345_c0_g1_i1.p1 TRINITY_DN17345_c0_g1~~TRINITY_DN17345_c0_g1_i1.p1  ORF type:complete len:882 (+),score=174.91 TRINITY_DN17345_c0_g1_i1:352-2646(+)